MKFESLIDFVLPEAATAPNMAKRRYVFRGFIYVMAFAALSLISVGERLNLPTDGLRQVSLRGAVFSSAGLTAIFGLIALFGLFYELAKLIQSLDELQRTIHIRAMLVGCAGFAALSIGWGALGHSLPLQTLDPIIALPVVFVGYYGSLFVNRRQYS
jgi:hypothetical protein